MNEQVCIATAKRRCTNYLGTNVYQFRHICTSGGSADDGFGSLILISYSCSVVTIPPYLTSSSIGNYAIDRSWVHSAIYVHLR